MITRARIVFKIKVPARPRPPAVVALPVAAPAGDLYAKVIDQPAGAVHESERA
jgi:hypothetical protein